MENFSFFSPEERKKERERASAKNYLQLKLSGPTDAEKNKMKENCVCMSLGWCGNDGHIEKFLNSFFFCSRNFTFLLALLKPWEVSRKMKNFFFTFSDGDGQ